MTDATGRSFLSYRRTRLTEARLLVEAQHDLGIPTWQDLSELDEGHTEAPFARSAGNRDNGKRRFLAHAGRRKIGCHHSHRIAVHHETDRPE